MHAAAAYFYVLSIGYFGIQPGFWTFQFENDYACLPGLASTFKTSSMVLGPPFLATPATPAIQPIQETLVSSDDQLLNCATKRELSLNTFARPEIPLWNDSTPEPKQYLDAFYQPLRDLPYAHVMWCPELLRVKYGMPAELNIDHAFHSGGFSLSDEQILNSLVQLSKKWQWSTADRTIVPRKLPQRYERQSSEPRLIFTDVLWYFDPDSCVRKVECTPIRTWRESVKNFTAHEEATTSTRRTFLEFLLEYKEPPSMPTGGFSGLNFYF